MRAMCDIKAIWKQVKRLVLFILGMIMVSMGIVFCKKCNMGISPISGIPFVLNVILPISFGTLTMMFHLVNTGIQMILKRRVLDIKLLSQIPFAIVFGRVIDLFNSFISFDQSILLLDITALAISIIFTAMGMVCMMGMNLVQNPPDGTVMQIAMLIHKETGTIKLRYDLCCVAISVVIGKVVLGRAEGFGVATIASAMLVGPTMSVIKKITGKKLIYKS